MKQYIDRETAINELSKIPAYFSDGGVRYGVQIASAEIEKLPAADVRENIHAKWIDAYPEIEHNPIFMYGICSNCRAEIGKKTKFCSECGAVMDLE